MTLEHTTEPTIDLDAPPATPFLAALTRLAEDDPDRPALSCDGTTLSRRALLDRAERVAQRFDSLGVGPGSVVAVGLANSMEFVEALLAVWWLGATPLPLSHRLPEPERRAILDLAGPSLTITDSDSDSDSGGLTADDIRRAAAGPGDGRRLPWCASPGWKIVTSGGSTGRPKLIVSEQPALVEAIVPAAALFRLPADGCILVTGPLSHNAPFLITSLGLLLGNHVVLMSRFDAGEALRLVEQHRVGWVYLVPTMMLRIWRLPREEREGRDLASISVVYHMAAPCPAWLKEAWIDWLGPDTILELYGGTEGQALTMVTGTEWRSRRGTVGRPVLGEIETRDETGRRLGPGEVGELWLRRGPGERAPYHYIGARARSAGGGWESLGDIGYLDSDGYVYLTDRLADMIVVGGSNVYPAEVEAALDEHPAVRSSCVIGLPDEDLGNVPHAIVELAEPVDDAALILHVRRRLAPYKVPRSIERVGAPLRDDAGKLRRSALRAERSARAAAGRDGE